MKKYQVSAENLEQLECYSFDTLEEAIEQVKEFKKEDMKEFGETDTYYIHEIDGNNSELVYDSSDNYCEQIIKVYNYKVRNGIEIDDGLEEEYQYAKSTLDSMEAERRYLNGEN